jgi:hypothetical protein
MLWLEPTMIVESQAVKYGDLFFMMDDCCVLFCQNCVSNDQFPVEEKNRNWVLQTSSNVAITTWQFRNHNRKSTWGSCWCFYFAWLPYFPLSLKCKQSSTAGGRWILTAGTSEPNYLLCRSPCRVHSYNYIFSCRTCRCVISVRFPFICLK